VIVCHCLVVNDAAVVEAVEAGATTLAKVCQATGAGTDCGSCVFSVKALLCQHDVSRASLGPEVPAAAGESAHGRGVQRPADVDVRSLTGAAVSQA
jgi:bacterioferritin-associated ferredoxin